MSQVLTLHSRQHDVLYIDPSKSSNGDGSTPSNALKEFPKTAAEYPTNVVFIVRRTNAESPAVLPNNLQIDSRSLVIWGMPKANESTYELVPAEVKTAWGSDSASKAYILANHNSSDPGYNAINLQANNCRCFDMQNIVYMHTNSLWVGIIARCVDYGCDATIHNVWFRTTTDWVNTQTNPSNAYDGGMWLHLNTGSEYAQAHACTMTSCVIDLYADNSSINIDLGQSDYIDIRDIDINVSQGARGTIISAGSDHDKKSIVSIDNVTAKYYYNSKRTKQFPRIINMNCAIVSMTNTSYTKGASQYMEPADNTINFENSGFGFDTYSVGSIFKNINIEYDDIIGERAVGLRVSFTKGRLYNPVGQYITIDNVSICCETGSNIYHEESQNTTGSYLYNRYSGYDYNYHCMALTSSSDRPTSSEFLLKDVRISAPKGLALYANYAMFDMSSCDILGSCAIHNSMGKIGKIESWYPGTCVYDGGSNLLSIGEIKCNRQNANHKYNGQYAVIPNWNSNILVTTCNTEMMQSSYNFDEIRRGSYICTNNNNFLGNGNFFVRTQREFCKTWSVNRVGSVGGCSLKLYNESEGENRRYPLLIGGAPFKGITKSVQRGNHVAKIYATTFGYNDPNEIGNHLRVRIKRTDGSIISGFDGNWSLDTTSTWENIESHTSFVLEIPFSVDDAQDIEFEYAFSWAYVGAATYLDPHPIIS